MKRILLALTALALLITGKNVQAQDAHSVKFVFQVPLGAEMALNKEPGGYFNFFAGVGVDYIPRNFSAHIGYVPFANMYSVFDVNGGYIFDDGNSTAEKGVMVNSQDLGDKVQMTFQGQEMAVRNFKRIRLGYYRMFAGSKSQHNNNDINAFYLGYESNELVSSEITALNNWYVDLMYGTYEGEKASHKNDMNNWGGRVGYSSDWGWWVSSTEEIGYKPISGLSLSVAVQVFLMF